MLDGATNKVQVRLSQCSPGYMRVTFDNPPLNVMGPEFVLEIREVVNALETDEGVKVVVFDSAIEGFFLNHSDFLSRLEDLTAITGRWVSGCSLAAVPWRACLD